MFFPVFDFGAGGLDLAFDLMGNVLPADEASSSMAGVFQQVGESFLSAGDALSDSPTKDRQSSSYVNRHWLEFTLVRPDGTSRVFERDIARWSGNVQEFSKSLARTAYFRVATGRVSAGQILERSLVAQKQLLASLGSPSPLKLEDVGLIQFSMDAETFLLMSDLAAAGDDSVVSFRDEPAIVARYLPYGRIDLSRDGFDIINSPRRALASRSGVFDGRATVLNGVVDSWLEHELFGRHDPASSSFGRLSQRLNAGGVLSVFGGDSSLQVQALPSPVRDPLRRDLATGARVILAGKQGECDAWWRIDPVSGATLSILGNGWGGVVPGYLRDLAAVHGKLKIASLAAGCGMAVPFITASAAVNGLGLLELNDALGNSNLDICSQIPSPNVQTLCTLTVAAMGMAAATGAGQSGMSTGVLMRICVMSAL